MSTLKKYNLTGQELGSVKVSSDFVKAEANSQMVKDYIIALRANARQWSANTKGRSEVNHTTKKPHPQKGGGRARQGSLAAPQYKGGGRVFAPKPKFDQHVRINKQERRAAIRFLLGEKIKEGQVHIIEHFDINQPKTKHVASLIKTLDLKGRVLFLGESTFAEIPHTEGSSDEGSKRVSVSSDKHSKFSLSLRNIPKTMFSLASNISGYDVMLARNIVMTEMAYNELNQWLNVQS